MAGRKSRVHVIAKRKRYLLSLDASVMEHLPVIAEMVGKEVGFPVSASQAVAFLIVQKAKEVSHV